jgi:hypothetical protein
MIPRGTIAGIAAVLITFWVRRRPIKGVPL